MNDSVFWFFLATLQAAFTGYTKHTFHINVADDILEHRIFCDALHSGPGLAPGSNIA